MCNQEMICKQNQILKTDFDNNSDSGIYLYQSSVSNTTIYIIVVIINKIQLVRTYTIIKSLQHAENAYDQIWKQIKEIYE